MRRMILGDREYETLLQTSAEKKSKEEPAPFASGLMEPMVDVYAETTEADVVKPTSSRDKVLRSETRQAENRPSRRLATPSGRIRRDGMRTSRVSHSARTPARGPKNVRMSPALLAVIVCGGVAVVVLAALLVGGAFSGPGPLEQLGSPDEATARQAMRKVIAMGPEAIRPLEAILSDRRASEARKRAAARTLARIVPEGREFVSTILLYANRQQLRPYAYEALLSLGDDEALDLVASSVGRQPTPVQLMVARRLGRYQQPQSVAALLALCASPGGGVATAAGKSLTEALSAGTVPLVAKVLTEGSPEQVDAAREALETATGDDINGAIERAAVEASPRVRLILQAILETRREAQPAGE